MGPNPFEQGMQPPKLWKPSQQQHSALKVAKQYDLLIIDGPARASSGTLEIAKVANLVVSLAAHQMTIYGRRCVNFIALVKAGIPKDKLVFALNRVGTESEEEAARTYIAEAGYSVLDGSLLERPAYRQAQNVGHAVTETSYRKLNKRADALIPGTY